MRIEGENTLLIYNNEDVVGQKVESSIPNKNYNKEEYLPSFFSERELIEGIESANEKIQVYNSKLEFSIHEKTKDIMIKVIDTQTNEVIREIPPKKILDLVASFLEKAGILVDKRA